MTRKKPPTMADVADLAGVSPMTVSRALRPNTSTSKQTREKIIKAADQLGYVLDSTASGLSSRHSGFVAMTIPSINNTNFADTLRGLSEGLKDTGLELLLGYTNYDMSEEERIVKSFLRRRPEAIVVTGGNHTEQCRRLLSNCGVPVIETWDLPEAPIDSVVGFSNAKASELIAEHLFELGCRKIGFIGGHTQQDTRGSDRRAGFLAKLRALGLSDEYVAETGPPPTSMNGGAAALRDLLDRHPEIEAVMCVSDPAAFGAMMEAQRRGLRIPQDIKIAGFGADDISTNCIPTLTTVSVGTFQIGVKAAEIIRNALASPSEPLEPDHVETACRLIVGGSTSHPDGS